MRRIKKLIAVGVINAIMMASRVQAITDEEKAAQEELPVDLRECDFEGTTLQNDGDLYSRIRIRAAKSN